MQIISLTWGVLALLGMFLGFIPFLGAFNWLNIPFGVAGLIVSIIAFNFARAGNKVKAMTGIICNCAAIFLGIIRLILGGGLL